MNEMNGNEVVCALAYGGLRAIASGLADMTSGVTAMNKDDINRKFFGIKKLRDIVDRECSVASKNKSVQDQRNGVDQLIREIESVL